MVASRAPTARRVVVGTVMCAVIGLQLYRQGSGTTRLYQGISSVSVDSGAGLPPEETEAVGLATAASAPAALPPPKPAAAAKDIVSRGAAAKLTASPPTPAHAVPMASPPPPCLSRSCTKRLSALEPAWVDLRYIMPAYCNPPGQPSVVNRHAKWPSLERIEAADVHVHALPKAALGDIVKRLPNRTFMLMGDSVMEQFYNAVQCFLRREALEEPPDADFRAFIKRNAGCGASESSNEPLWKMGKRKMPPKLPQQTKNGMRMLFARAVGYEPEDLTAAMATANALAACRDLATRSISLSNTGPPH
ncbi:hypothetical protein EMIHUDRAFT_105133 [Emiliania huxleyi CCMP1516]|uniref:Amidohydrolase-related domain-containing protein n=2 Tax=Emiliania huxleyi TaxID=2903 RepID=A0A0D3IHG9_EMIH1|nr:hypothetical protein EMIHUDRAFT_105133 [Emiliania huxleyi CCMP1516]EOD10704.1 hypothetical protein EMIHUDRAFT_105133 [Emiliania huxleyi CCMP1516]|eukprot:XP_005763133.1 hypothetical protein EMIHUDRAFT_105133 [Emiliania huxleyi CCMP1516]